MKKNRLFKRIMSVLLTGIMVFSLAACGNTNQQGDSDQESASDTQAAGGVESGSEDSAEDAVQMEDTTINVTLLMLFWAGDSAIIDNKFMLECGR